MALCGYTNAGKSSLLNALTGSEALVENKLFATLDPLTRRLKTAGAEILLTDTVGFISNLPHQLIDAFKSTLEEAAQSDALLIVLDASDPNAPEQAKTVLKVLEEVGAGKKERIVALNKIDAAEAFSATAPDGAEPECKSALARVAELKENFPGAIETSAKTGAGLDKLKQALRRFGQPHYRQNKTLSGQSNTLSRGCAL